MTLHYREAKPLDIYSISELGKQLSQAGNDFWVAIGENTWKLCLQRWKMTRFCFQSWKYVSPDNTCDFLGIAFPKAEI